MSIYKSLKCAAVVAAMAVSGTASALVTTTFVTVDDEYTAQYIYAIDGSSINASVKYKLTAFDATADTATFEIVVTNNSSGGAVDAKNALMSFGVDVVAPKLDTVTEADAMWDTELNVNLPSFQKIDFCAYASNGCTGGDVNDGLQDGGATSTFSVTMNFSGDLTTAGVTFTSPFPAKFQSVGLQKKSYEVDISNCTGDGCRPPQEVPEPGSLALVGLAMLGLGAIRRRAT